MNSQKIIDIIQKYQSIRENWKEHYDLEDIEESSKYLEITQDGEFDAYIDEFNKYLDEFLIMTEKYASKQYNEETITLLFTTKSIKELKLKLEEKKSREELDIEVGLILAEMKELIEEFKYSKLMAESYLEILERYDSVLNLLYGIIGIEIIDSVLLSENDEQETANIGEIVNYFTKNVYYSRY